MKPFIGIIGYSGSGKSSIIRSLAGSRIKSEGDFVQDILTNEKIWVFPNSPQESDLKIPNIEKALKTVISSPSYRGMICAIQPTRPRVKISMEDIYTAVQVIGGFKPYGFIIEPGFNLKKWNLVNEVASRLSSFTVDQTGINGNSFPYKNAEIIQSSTNIIH